jgi:ATP-dependent DNA helicase RecQ
MPICHDGKMPTLQLESTLKRYFGFDTFRENQHDIIEAIMADQDVLAVLPTGSGKSLCYQLPALHKAGTTIVVSPLIALMSDQVGALHAMGVPAVAINSQCSHAEIYHIMSNFSSYKLIYAAPERLLMPDFLDALTRLPIATFVIDEAHCISQWGHAFRPEYRQLATLKQRFPRVPIAAFTATATPQVRRDIMTQLDLQIPFQITADFDRPNLTLRVAEREKPREQLLQFLREHADQSGIIYTTTRKDVDKWHQFLKNEGFAVGKYHAGLPDYERHQSQTDFLHDRTTIMVATVAFGMGVNKPDLRFVVHMDMPKSFEGYYQEIGRAGRDSLPADCLMLYKTHDYLMQKRMYADIEDENIRTGMLRRLEQFFAFCHSHTCRRKEILHYFGQTYAHESCPNCDNCTDDVTSEDATVIAQKILSCVYRMQQRFGLTMVIDVLQGANTQAITHNKFNQLSTYGLLSDMSKLEIRHYIFSLINQNYLYITEGEYPLLKLAKDAEKVLKGDQRVSIRKRKIAEKNPKLKADSKPELVDIDISILQQLKNLRAKLAKQKNIPPYMIFHDKHLQHMAQLRPQTKAQFAQVPGVGDKKLDMYAALFLEVLTA